VPIWEWEVDHIDHVRKNNLEANLRFLTHRDNLRARARSSRGDRDYGYVSWLPLDAMVVDQYNGYTFTNYHYSPAIDCFYYDTGAGFRVLEPCRNSNGRGTPFVWCEDDNGDMRAIVVRQWRLRHGFDV
jgi:hypothetical protein